MKFKLNALILILTSLQLFSQNNFGEKDELIFKNRIKEKLTYCIDLNNKNYSLLLNKEVFNKKGQTVEELKYKVVMDSAKTDMTDISTKIFVYQQKVRTFGFQNKIDSLENGEVYESNSIKYSPNDKINKINFYQFDKLHAYEMFTYDKEEKSSYIKRYLANGNLLTTRKIQYNKKNLRTKLFRKIEQKFTDRFPTTKKYYIGKTFFYNKDNKLTKIKGFNFFGKPISIYKYNYQKKSSTIRFYQIDIKTGDKTLNSIITETYDESKRIIKNEIIYPTLNVKTEHLYVYDNENKPIERTVYKNGILIEKLVYKYKKFKEQI